VKGPRIAHRQKSDAGSRAQGDASFVIRKSVEDMLGIETSARRPPASHAVSASFATMLMAENEPRSVSTRIANGAFAL